MRLKNEHFRDLHRFFEHPPDLFLALLAGSRETSQATRVAYIIRLLGIDIPGSFQPEVYMGSPRKKRFLEKLLQVWSGCQNVVLTVGPLTDGTNVYSGVIFDALRQIEWLTPRTEAVLITMLDQETGIEDAPLRMLEIGLLSLGLAYRIAIEAIPLEDLRV